MGEPFIPAVVVSGKLRPHVRRLLVNDLQARLMAIGVEMGDFPMGNREVVDGVREVLDMCQTIAAAIHDLSDEPTDPRMHDAGKVDPFPEHMDGYSTDPFPDEGTAMADEEIGRHHRGPLAPWEDALLNGHGEHVNPNELLDNNDG